MRWWRLGPVTWAGAWPFVAAALTLALALARVGDTSLWLDEGSTSLVVRDRSFVGLAWVLGGQYSIFFPYLVVLWFWAQVSEADEWLRMLSVFGGVIAVGVTCSLCRRWFGTRVSVLAGVLCVVSPYFLRYLTELRGYSWSMALSVLVLWWLDRALSRGRRFDAVALGVTCGLMIANHVLAVFVLLPLLLALAVTGQVTAANVRAVGVPALLAGFVAFAPAAPALIHNPARQDWIPPLSWSALSHRLTEFLDLWQIGAVIAVGLAAAVVAVVADRAARRDWRVMAVVLQAALTVPIHVVVSVIRPVYIERYFAAAFPAVVMASAYGIVRLADRSARAVHRGWIRDVTIGAALVAVSVAFVADGPLTDEPRPGDPEAAVEFVLDRIRPGELIVVNDFATAYLPYLGARPDIDPGHLPASDRRFGGRRPIGEFVDRLEASPVVYVLGWYTNEFEPEIARLAADRRVVEHRLGGLTAVWVLSLT